MIFLKGIKEHTCSSAGDPAVAEAIMSLSIARDDDQLSWLKEDVCVIEQVRLKV